jgi:predicted flap endonuclease-1-like 5' DNA nuclease
MSYKITEIEGIGPTFADRLESADIVTTADLLEKCGSAAGRRAVAKTSDVSEKKLLSWANMADLMRISGVGEEYSDLLHAAGVDTIKELRNRNADNLADKMREINDEKDLTRTVPSGRTVAKWVAAAKELEPAISH